LVYDYLITLKRPDYNVIDIISQLLYLVAFSAFIFFASRTVNLVNMYWLAAFIILVVYVVVKQKKKKEGLAYYTPGLAIAAVTWLIGEHTNWIMFALFAACTLIERELKFKKEVGFSNEEVVFNTLLKKRYEYNAFRNVLIKDGLLTMDFSNNKIVQREIDGEVTNEIEEEFNAFCKTKIENAPAPEQE